MIAMITLDNNYSDIWEKTGVATFHTRYEGRDKIHIIQNDIICKTVYAIGLYRTKKSLAQNNPPSLLRITNAEILKNCEKCEHDIRIYFEFSKKISIELNEYLHKIIPKPTPLIRYIEDSYFFEKQKILKSDEL